MVIFKEINELTIAESINAYCAICSYAGIKKSYSIYVLGCEDYYQAEVESKKYFKKLLSEKNGFFNDVPYIEILPYGHERFETAHSKNSN